MQVRQVDKSLERDTGLGNAVPTLFVRRIGLQFYILMPDKTAGSVVVPSRILRTFPTAS